MTTPRVVLIQELVREDPWKVAIVSTLVCRTPASRVRRVATKLFARYPSPASLAGDSYHGSVDHHVSDVALLLKPLGLHESRAPRLVSLSRFFADWYAIQDEPPSSAVLSELAGVGPYVARCYAVFVDGDLGKSEPEDAELARFWRWAVLNEGAYRDLCVTPRVLRQARQRALALFSSGPAVGTCPACRAALPRHVEGCVAELVSPESELVTLRALAKEVERSGDRRFDLLLHRWHRAAAHCRCLTQGPRDVPGPHHDARCWAFRKE